MFIAHLPAGYLLSKPLQKLTSASPRASATAVMAGSVFPDIDLLRCYFVDGGKVPHHTYWTHLPFAWLLIGLAALTVTTVLRERRARAISAAFLTGVFSHLVLDSVAAGILWRWPFDSTWFELVHVPAAYAFWPASFLLHWTFAIELLVCAAAAMVLAEARQKSRLHRALVALNSRTAVIEPARRYSDLLVIRRAGNR